MSAANDLNLLGIKQKDLHLLRNDRIKFDCGPMVYRTIIYWGFAKPNSISIKDHFDYLKIGEKNKDKFYGKLNKWVERNELKLQKYSFSDFDITTLHDFLPILCHDKITQTYTSEYTEQTKDPHTVESLLKEIKDFRNEVSHEYAEAVKDSHINTMKETMRECIRVAGKLYNKDQTEIDDKVKDLDDEFDKIILDTTHFYENRVKYISKFIETEVPAILLERYSPHFTVPLPGNWTKKVTSDIFQCSNLSVPTEDEKGKFTDNKIIFSCTEIHNKTHDQFVVINGGPGSGKTTLMKNICQDILHTSVHGSAPRYEKNEQFKIPIYLECRNEQPTSLATFLKESLKNFFSPEDDIYEAFKIVEKLVFLIDGYDEITNTSRKLVDSIIDFCRDYNATCIVSSRVDAGNNFINELQRKNLNCTKMFIEPISEIIAKVSFLKSYAVIMDDSIDIDKLVNSFDNLTEAAQEVFSSPILLALFISLFVHDPNSVSQFKNEQSAYEAVRTSFIREMARKLRNIPNSKGRAMDVVNVLSKFCLKFFLAKKYFLDEDDYLKMVGECEIIRGMRDDVDIPSLLLCILTPENSLNCIDDTSYQFMHSTIQEFFAAKYVIKTIRELTDDRSSQSQSEGTQVMKLLQLLGLDVTQPDIKEETSRYGNIIKFLILETLSNGELSKYSNTFTLLLMRYFGPGPEGYSLFSPIYHLDLILSSGSNAEVISIVSDCLRGKDGYKLEYYRHINPMTEVAQVLKCGITIIFVSYEVTNTQKIIKLLTGLGDDSEIDLELNHSYYNYQPLDGEFYTQLQKSKCKVIHFTGCITSGEHLSILVRALTGDWLFISTPSVYEISFAALGEYEGFLYLTVKYTDDCPSTGSNSVTGETKLTIENIPVDGKENVIKTLEFICPKSKEFSFILLNNCHLTETDVNEMLEQLHEKKIRTEEGLRTEVDEMMVNEDKSRDLRLSLKKDEEEENEEEENKEEASDEEESEEEESEAEESDEIESEEERKKNKIKRKNVKKRRKKSYTVKGYRVKNYRMKSCKVKRPRVKSKTPQYFLIQFGS